MTMLNNSFTQCHHTPKLAEGSHLVHCTDRVCPDRQQQSVAGTVITGTGRAGTSFLMAVQSTLGMPTGFQPSSAKVLETTSWHAGFEAPSVPACRCRGGHTLCVHFGKDVQIIKKPQLAEQNQFPLWLAPPVSGLANVIVPVRSSTESAASRAANGNRNGGFSLGAIDDVSQQHADEHLLSTLMVELSKQDVNVTLLHYPSHVIDPHYSALKLEWLLRRYNISTHAFTHAHQSLLNMSLVHSKPHL